MASMVSLIVSTKVRLFGSMSPPVLVAGIAPSTPPPQKKQKSMIAFPCPCYFIFLFVQQVLYKPFSWKYPIYFKE